MPRRPALLAAVVVALVFAVGTLPVPLMDDQTLFLLGARILHGGGTLYRDYWDIKPPGVFLLYWAAGSLFGFDAVGIHLFELAWMSLLGVAMWAALRGPLGAAAAVAALFTVGGFYLVRDEYWLTLVEPISWLPLFVGFAALVRAAGRPSAGAFWIFTAGLMAGVVAIFKPLLSVIPAALFVAWLLSGQRWRSALTTVGLAALGAAVPIGALLLWFRSRGAVALLKEALVDIPAEIAGGTNPWTRLLVLRVGVEQFAARAGVLLVLIAAGAALWWREPRTARTGHDSAQRRFVRLGALVWLAAAALAVLAQVQSWWSYHWLLLVPPMAILAADATAALAAARAAGGASAHRAALAWTMVVLAAVPLAVRVVRSVPLVAAGWGALNPRARQSFQGRVNRRVTAYAREAAFPAEAGAPPGSIYVWGSPLIYAFSGRAQASPVQGWNLDLMSRGLYRRLYADLARTRPAYVFLEHWPYEHVVRENARLAAFLGGYIVARADSLGTWYRSATHGP